MPPEISPLSPTSYVFSTTISIYLANKPEEIHIHMTYDTISETEVASKPKGAGRLEDNKTYRHYDRSLGMGFF